MSITDTDRAATIEDILPDRESGRWSAGDKEEIVLAIKRKRISVEAVLRAVPHLTKEELNEWRENFKARGRKGLKVTKRLRRRHHSIPAPARPKRWRSPERDRRLRKRS